MHGVCSCLFWLKDGLVCCFVPVHRASIGVYRARMIACKVSKETSHRSECFRVRWRFRAGVDGRHTIRLPVSWFSGDADAAEEVARQVHAYIAKCESCNEKSGIESHLHSLVERWRAQKMKHGVQTQSTKTVKHHAKKLLVQLKRNYYGMIMDGSKTWEARPLKRQVKGDKWIPTLFASLATPGRIVVLQSGAHTNDLRAISDVRHYQSLVEMIDELGSELLPHAVDKTQAVHVYRELYPDSERFGFVAFRIAQ